MAWMTDFSGLADVGNEGILSVLCRLPLHMNTIAVLRKGPDRSFGDSPPTLVLNCIENQSAAVPMAPRVKLIAVEPSVDGLGPANLIGYFQLASSLRIRERGFHAQRFAILLDVELALLFRVGLL